MSGKHCQHEGPFERADRLIQELEHEAPCDGWGRHNKHKSKHQAWVEGLWRKLEDHFGWEHDDGPPEPRTAHELVTDAVERVKDREQERKLEEAWAA